MKKTIKFLAVLTALVLALAVFAACGQKADTGSGNENENVNSGEQTEPTADEVKGAMGEHGYYKVFVPEGYTLVHEDVFGDVNPDSFNINLTDSAFTYFMFSMYEEENAKLSVETTRELNDGAADVTLEANGKTWTGVAYESVGIDCFTLYANFDGNFVLVSGAGNAYDSDLVQTVLGSLEVNVTE